MMTHELPIRIYYEDTDTGGVVYYANYLKFAERGRTELLRARGLENSVLQSTCGILIVVKHVEIDYKKPARLDDSLLIKTSVVDIGASSVKMAQSVYRDAELICQVDVVLVCISAATGRPVRWPKQLAGAFVDNGHGE